MTIRKFVSLAVSVLLFAAACSKQGQGDRCNSSNASNDCEDGLVCQEPLGGVQICDPDPAAPAEYNCQPWRCCPTFGVAPSDARCIGYNTNPQLLPSGSDAGDDAGQ